MNNKQKLVYLSLIALTIIGILSGASYAYFSIENQIGNETVIESGTMALTFTDGSTITADKLIPGEYIEKTFSVRNTGTVRTNYDIYLSEVVNTFVNQSDLVYEIISSNGYNTSNQVQVPNTETKIINNYPIDPLQEHTYTIRITYKLTNEVQNDNMGRTFIAKINVNEYNQNNSERYIKLIDSSNNLLDKQVITNNTDYYYNLNNYDLTNSTNIYCNNGSIPTIENNTLKVSEVTTATDCKVSNSINTTIDNLPNTKTGIVMTNNQSDVTPMNILSNKEVILDLNGKEINSVGVNDTSTTWNANHSVFDIYGILTVNDSIGTGGAYTGTTNRVISVGKNGNVTINGGNYSGRQAVYSSGSNSSVVINNGNYSNKYGPVIVVSDDCQNCNITINNGDFSSDGVDNTIYTVTDGGSITINGGNFSNSSKIVIYNNKGTININGGIFTSLGKTIENNSGIINVNGGNFESTNSQTVYNSGTINIIGGTFESANNSAIYNKGALNINQSDKPIYIISENVNSGDIASIYTTGATTIINANQADKCTSNYQDTLNGLCVIGVNSYAIKSDKSNVTIDGGTYNLVGNIRQSINNQSGTINIKNAFIDSQSSAIANGAWYSSKGIGNPGTINICSSIIKSKGWDLYEENTDAYITYSNDNIFSNGTNTPDSNKVYGSVNPTGAACDW